MIGLYLERGPDLFDGIYTGTETRDAVVGNQHLQPYHGYSIMRYFENISQAATAAVGWTRLRRAISIATRSSCG